MSEIYDLNKEALPTIPTPHDCVVKEIRREGQALVFLFEDDIFYHESIQFIHPTARSLIIRYHLTEKDAFSVYHWEKPGKFSRKDGCYRRLDNEELFKIAGRMDYLSQNIGHRSIIIQLSADDIVILDACVDYLEYEWIEASK